MTNPLLDPQPVSPARLQRLEATIASLLQTRLDVVLAQGEAVLPLEAAARAVGRIGVVALNLTTGPYGAAIGRWLCEAGATVIGIEAEPRKAVEPEEVERTLRTHPEISVVSFVHVEAASGVRNDAEAIAGLARESGALVVLDVVASVGAHEVRLDDWGIDIAVIGPQKALAGPSGISIAALSGRAWQTMRDNPGAPRGSVLSLLDWKDRWVGSARSTVPRTPSPLEILALEAAVERVLAEGLQSVQRRHRASATASRCGARALGLAPFVSDADAAVVATTLAAPPGIDARSLVERARADRPVAVSSGFGELARTVVRIDHTGQRARLSVVLEALEALGTALSGSSQLHGSIPSALATAERAWSAEEARSLP